MSRLFNAYLGAGLATALVIAGLAHVAGAIFEPRKPERPGVLIDSDVVCGGCGDTADQPLPDWGSILPSVDAAQGKAAFAKCTSCHTIAPGGADQIGPNLYGIVGRRPASRSSFAYSDAITAFSAKATVWDDDQLFAFLRAPQKHLPGTKMTFAGIRNEDERMALIGYLRSQGATLPVPPPDPTRRLAEVEAE